MYKILGLPRDSVHLADSFQAVPSIYSLQLGKAEACHVVFRELWASWPAGISARGPPLRNGDYP